MCFLITRCATHRNVMDVHADPFRPQGRKDGRAVDPQPGQFEANDLTITMGMECGPEGQKPVNASWQFTGKKGKTDVYNFTITVPIGQSTLTTSNTIIYDGKEQKVFEDKQIKIYIKPEK